MTHPAASSLDLATHARQILEENRYLTLGTVDTYGQPWTTPVFFAPAPQWRFLWISAREAQHSRNLANRSRVSLVVFDSTVRPHHGTAVYATGTAVEIPDDEIAAALLHYPGHGRDVQPMTRDDVNENSPYRFYQATASTIWVLCPRKPEQPCQLHGMTGDHRVRVA